MDVAIVVLRIALGLAVIGHGLQKSRGLFNGPGLTATAQAFDAWGFRPGRFMVIAASTCEIGGGLLLVVGFATPAAAAVVLGTLIVACTPNFSKGFWAARGGYELPFAYAVMAVTIGFAGAGRYSFDALLNVPSGPLVGVLVVLVGVVGAIPLIVLRRNSLKRERTLSA